ncbi:MAG TPA: glycosyltransferase [Candidatus Polarisedimenticolaceae bacterium]|nr:glycosyltransferase [Candidatus Polarisedimenticolaceae bacterium]
MLSGQSIVCFAHDWNADPTSKTHIMRILAGRNRVLWVNSIAMRRPAATRADVGRLATKLRRILGGYRQVAPNLHVVDPLVVPFPGRAAVDRLNAALLALRLRGLCRRLGQERPILWTYMPNVNRLLGRLGERRVVYHCVDEYAAFSGVPRAAIARMERELVRRADVVLTSSEQLRRERMPFNPNTHFVSHGVDLEHFAGALDPRTPQPPELRALPRPVIGFIGLVADWVDLSLIHAVARAYPQGSVVLIGKTATDVTALRGIGNIHLLGRRPYTVLPGYCRGIDVAIVPFRINELTLRANPLKLREYLAAGLPVVSTRLPEVERYAELVQLADGPAEFVGAVARALHQRSADEARRRAAAMRGESWETRVEEISTILEGRPAA